MEHIKYQQAIAELVQVNPYQTIATFIFADDKPNMNKQGLPFSEFERVAKTAIGMPVKMRFTGDGFIQAEKDIENHDGSIPIGVIQSMEIKTISDDYHQLIAQAALWNDEYPEEITWLKKKFAEGKAPGLSYEINFNDFERDDENIQWIKDTYTGAATFVKTPAYGTRTALIALASIQDKTVLEEGILAIAEKLTAKHEPKGGNRVDEKELEALKGERDTFKAEAASKQSEIENLNKSITDLGSEIETLKTENSNLKQAALVDSRLREYSAAGFQLEAEAEKADAKKSLFASFSDDQWTSYLADLTAIKAQAAAAAPQPDNKGVAMASLRTTIVPRPDNVDTSIDVSSLAQDLRGLARPNSAE